MNTTAIFISLVVTVLVFLAGYAGYDFLTRSRGGGGKGADSLSGRVRQVIGGEALDALGQDESAAVVESDPALASFRAFAGRLGRRFSGIPFVSSLLMTPANLDRLERRLTWAGRPLGFDAEQWVSVNLFLTGGVFTYSLFGYLSNWFGLPTMLLYIGIAAAAPTLWLNSKVKERREQFDRELPNLINKLVLASLGDGQDMMATLETVQEYTHGILVDELRLATTNRRYNRQMSPREAFQGMAERCGTPNVASFCETIIDAIDVRVRVTEVLRDQQESMKEIKRANNDALINKTDTYLMISAALGVMAVIVLVAAPSFVAILQGLSQTAGR